MRPLTTGGVPLIALALSLIPAPSAAQAAADGYPPRFEEAACPFSASREVLQGIRCGWLEVPENRAAPEGRRLRLAVAILKSPSPTPRPDPLVFLHGGPGQATVQFAPRIATSRAWSHLRAERDLILYDQRGTGLSEPGFCPSLEVDLTMLPLQGLSREAFSEGKRAAFARCAAEMAERGVDLSQYNSVASALDLRDLRLALGLEQWNVWGVSYGGRLGLEAMRTAPGGIRAVVLDSPVPPNATIWADIPAGLTDGLERTFARCAADGACAAAFPDAERRFWDLLDALDREPIAVPLRAVPGSPDTMRVTGRLLAEGLFGGLYQPAFHAALPLLMREVERRNQDLLVNLAQQLRPPLGLISLGLQWTIECNETAPFNDANTRPASNDSRILLLERLGVGADARDCDALHPFRAKPERHTPVASELPVLFVAGALDTGAPAEYSRQAALTLPNSRVVVLPGGGHWVMHRHECTRRVMLEFLADPAAPIDASCADSIQPPSFVTDVRLTPGVPRIASMFGPAASPATLGGAAAPLLVLLSAVLGWPAAALWSRIRRRERPVRTHFERRARFGAAGVALLSLAFVGALAVAVMQAMGENPYVLALGLPASAAPLLAVPWVLLAGSLGLVLTAALAWRRGAWTRAGRIHFALVAAASLVVAVGLIALGLV
jgi:pimeloyl-ACP methyl ester carboxylesterase